MISVMLGGQKGLILSGQKGLNYLSQNRTGNIV